MKKQILKAVLFGVVLAALAAAPLRAVGEDKKDEKAAAAATENEKPKRDTVPFRGKVGAIDKDAMTFTIGERTFHVTSDSKITKNGKTATLADAAVGDEVGGVAKKAADGKLNVTSVRFGPKPENEKEN